MTADITDDERREVARRLREYVDLPDDWWQETCAEFYVEKCVFGNVDRHSEAELFTRLADLIEPDTTSDTTKSGPDTTKVPNSHPNSGTAEVTTSRVPKCDPTERGVDSIYDWCFERLEGADGAEDYLYCTIMRTIEDYRHPERATAHTVRPVDRDALLALADDMRRHVAMDERSRCHRRVSPEEAVAYADRIREALGVES